jgi:flagellar biosynthesis GTPase FlhF
MEREEKEAEKTSSSPSLFPLFAAAAASSSITQQQTNTPINDTVPPPPPPAWLYNTSFTTDLSIVNDAVSSLHPSHHSDSDLEEQEEDKDDRVSNQGKDRSYQLLQEPEEEKTREAKYSRSDSDYSDSGRERKKTKKRRHSKKKKRDRSRDEEDARDFGSRKSNVRVWAGSDTKTTKDYYFDTHGDRDNLVYGTLYRYFSLYASANAVLLRIWTELSVFIHQLSNSFI